MANGTVIYLVDGDYDRERIYRNPETVICKNCLSTNRFVDEKCCNCGSRLK